MISAPLVATELQKIMTNRIALFSKILHQNTCHWLSQSHREEKKNDLFLMPLVEQSRFNTFLKFYKSIYFILKV